MFKCSSELFWVVEMWKESVALNAVLNVAVLLSCALVIVLAVYAFNLWFQDVQWPYILSISLAMDELVFMEGVFFCLLGLLEGLGKGSINKWSIKGILTFPLTERIGERVLRRKRDKYFSAFHSELFRGRLSIISIISGISMFIIYFHNL
jgi:hypothetical protein